MTLISTRLATKINLSLAFMFASGALLTTAIIHVIPEAMEGLEAESHHDLEGIAKRSGLTIMAGVFMGLALHIALESQHSHAHPQSTVLDLGHSLDTSNEERKDSRDESMVTSGSEPLTAVRAGATDDLTGKVNHDHYIHFNTCSDVVFFWLRRLNP